MANRVTAEQVGNQECIIRDLLDVFPDTSDLNEIYSYLIDLLESLSNNLNNSGSLKHVTNLKTTVEDLENIIEKLTVCIDELKKQTVEVTGSGKRRRETPNPSYY